MSLEVLGAFGACALMWIFGGEPITMIHQKASSIGSVQRLHLKASAPMRSFKGSKPKNLRPPRTLRASRIL